MINSPLFVRSSGWESRSRSRGIRLVALLRLIRLSMPSTFSTTAFFVEHVVIDRSVTAVAVTIQEREEGAVDVIGLIPATLTHPPTDRRFVGVGFLVDRGPSDAAERTKRRLCRIGPIVDPLILCLNLPIQLAKHIESGAILRRTRNFSAIVKRAPLGFAHRLAEIFRWEDLVQEPVGIEKK